MSKFTNSEIAEIVEDEHLTYAIIDAGISPSRIKDADLAEMWEEARDVLLRIQEHLDNHSDDAEEDEDEDEWDDEE